MAIHLYLDAALTQPLSEGNGSSPDADNYNGTDGESKDRQVWIANEQTLLVGAMDDSQVGLTLDEARFTDGEIIIVDAEQMQVQSGDGTTALTVSRGYGGTTPAAHMDGATVYSGYEYTGLALDPVDEDGSDESDWYALALTQAELDAATPDAAPGAAPNLGDKAHDQTLTFWRRCTVPPDTLVQNKLDLKLRLTGTEAPILQILSSRDIFFCSVCERLLMQNLSESFLFWRTPHERRLPLSRYFGSYLESVRAETAWQKRRLGRRRPR